MHWSSAGVLALAFAFLAVLAGPASAHSFLATTDPSQGARLTDAPDSVALQLSEAVVRGSVQISGVSGSLWDELTVQSFDLSMPDSGLAVSAKAFRLHWRPTKLVGGIVRIDELGASDVTVTLSPTTSAPPVEDCILRVD